MTIEEAIESLENDISYTVPVRNGTPTISIDNPERLSEAVDMAIQALEQNQEKLVKICREYTEEVTREATNYIPHAKCGNCEFPLSEVSQYNYCPNCGRKFKKQ